MIMIKTSAFVFHLPFALWILNLIERRLVIRMKMTYNKGAELLFYLR